VHKKYSCVIRVKKSLFIRYYIIKLEKSCDEQRNENEKVEDLECSCTIKIAFWTVIGVIQSQGSAFKKLNFSEIIYSIAVIILTSYYFHLQLQSLSLNTIKATQLEEILRS